LEKPEVISKESINIATLKEELNKIKKRDGELSFRGNKTEEYVNEFCNLKHKQADELHKKLEGLKFPRLKENQINKIIDTLPKSVNELKVIMQGYSVPISTDNQKKIISVVKDFLPKK